MLWWQWMTVGSGFMSFPQHTIHTWSLFSTLADVGAANCNAPLFQPYSLPQELTSQHMSFAVSPYFERAPHLSQAPFPRDDQFHIKCKCM